MATLSLSQWGQPSPVLSEDYAGYRSERDCWYTRGMSADPIDPVAARVHYQDFMKKGRTLLTGHSHQAWPDSARAGQMRAFDDAAEHVDDKWEHAAAAAMAVQSRVGALVGVKAEQVALGPNTHELLTRFLSSLDWSRGRHVVTTDGEFHSMRRQLTRLEEAGLEVTAVASMPAETLAERLRKALRPDTVALMTSTVLFQTSSVVPGLAPTVEAARQAGIQVLLDAYHAAGVVPFSLEDYGREDVFMVGGGYKYLQWGEGVCFMVVPEDCALRPVYTGWFSDYASLAKPQVGRVQYGKTPADRFAGSTYDPVSHYRARAVIEHFDSMGWSVPRLRAQNLAQTTRIINQLDGLDVLTPLDESLRGGFVAVRLANAGRLCDALRERGIFTDSRGDILRFGPAPYVTDTEIDQALETFRGLLRTGA